MADSEPLYLWEVPGQACGVTDDPRRARQYVAEILQCSRVGTCATVREVMLNLGREDDYIPTGETSEARRAPDGVEWIEEPSGAREQVEPTRELNAAELGE
ncbi:MAG: hypothetical protein GEV11_01040 [Streptosporangiales bacterium]|nr:hypothetical protein [Streptosporangiales bacterium]